VVIVPEPLEVNEGVLEGVSPAVLVPDVVVVPLKEGVHVLEVVEEGVCVAAAVTAPEGVCVCVFVSVSLCVTAEVTVVVALALIDAVRLPVLVRLDVWVGDAVVDRLMDKEGDGD
jgi:hypothetical protein